VHAAASGEELADDGDSCSLASGHRQAALGAAHPSSHSKRHRASSLSAPTGLQQGEQQHSRLPPPKQKASEHTTHPLLDVDSQDQGVQGAVMPPPPLQQQQQQQQQQHDLMQEPTHRPTQLGHA
jgi:hypothetical protein